MKKNKAEYSALDASRRRLREGITDLRANLYMVLYFINRGGDSTYNSLDKNHHSDYSSTNVRNHIIRGTRSFSMKLGLGCSKNSVYAIIAMR